MNLFTKQKQSHRCRKQTYGSQGGKGVGRDKLQDWNGHIHTTVHKIDKQQDLLYSTGYYIQYVVITYNGKESKYIYIFESLCYTPGTDTTP